MHHYPKVTIGLVLYKGEKYLKACLESLMRQTYPNIEYLFRDQSPNHETYNFIKKELPDVFKQVSIEKGENLFHSGGHNSLIRQMSGDYYFCCSNDMYYSPDFVSRLIQVMEKPENKKYGSATCKLMVWNFPLHHPDHSEIDKTNIIDSCGIGIKNNHYFYDVGQGEKDEGQYDQKKNIFGASGALAIYRKKALEEIAYHNEFFDELIHYKNDIDLAYRLQWAGYPCLFIPEVKVYHDRLASTPYVSKSKFMNIIKARKDKSRWIKENSFFGQQIVLIKHFNNKFSLWTKIRTTFHQWTTLIYVLLFEQYLLKQFKQLKRYEAEILAKRNAILRKVEPKEIEKLMS